MVTDYESIVLFRVLEIEMIAKYLFIGLVVIGFVGVYLHDRIQKEHTILRNYPVVGHLRYLFEYLGEFFRQYFYAMDREELPFDRATRSWVYRAAKNVENVVSFGSTRDLRPLGTIIFVDAPFPPLNQDVVLPKPMIIGPYCREPYSTRAFFNISGMSFGAISDVAIIALSNGARMAGCWMNTGEGGLSPYHLQGGADLVVQLGTAKYGFRDEHGHLSEERLRKACTHPQVKMFEIKLSQGAKPGKGGILPGAKVTPEIAEIRSIPPYQDSISPNRHEDIANVNELLNAVERIRKVTGKPVGFKLVLGDYGLLDDLCQEVLKRGIESAPDFITLDSKDGGTGAAPMSLVDYVGLPIKESLPILVDKLKQYNLRDRIKVNVSGKLVTPADVAWALCVGADFISSARGFMFALGCIQAMRCHLNTCPTGITTHNKRLQSGLDPTDKAVRVYHYATNIVHEVGVICHSVGVEEPRELQRHHARMVTETGLSVLVSDLYNPR